MNNKIKASNTKNAILLVGDGKLSQHLQFYFKSLGISFKCVSRRGNSPQQIRNAISQSVHILLALSDSGISDFKDKYYNKIECKTKKQIWVHFSGALSVKNLISVHPLMSFSGQIFSLEKYKKIHFVLSSNKGKKLKLNEIIPGLPNSYSYIADKEKAYYHTMCVIGGNFPIFLWSKMEKELMELNIPKAAIEIYLRNVLDNFIQFSSQALTGPIQRNDKITIKKNLNSLKEKKDSFFIIYQAFLKMNIQKNKSLKDQSV